MDALAFLAKPPKGGPKPIYVLHGDEDFLKRQVREILLPWLVDDADLAFAVSAYAGDTADWSTVRAELDTIPFIGPRRVVIIEQADKFVTQFRPQLEKFVAAPSKGVLVLEVRTWLPTTKLAKAVPDESTLVCKELKTAQLAPWCITRAKSAYGKKLDPAAARLLVELIEPSLGLLDQELAKLATYVGETGTITAEDVDVLVGRSRAAETFKIFDAVGAGQPAAALAILQRLLADGEEPIALLGAFSWQLRRIAQANRLLHHGMSVREALLEVGIREFGLPGAERLMKHLGSKRMDKLYDWLLEADLGMKGNSPLAPSAQLERLLVKLARSAG